MVYAIIEMWFSLGLNEVPSSQSISPSNNQSVNQSVYLSILKGTVHINEMIIKCEKKVGYGSFKGWSPLLTAAGGSRCCCCAPAARPRFAHHAAESRLLPTVRVLCLRTCRIAALAHGGRFCGSFCGTQLPCGWERDEHDGEGLRNEGLLLQHGALPGALPGCAPTRAPRQGRGGTRTNWQTSEVIDLNTAQNSGLERAFQSELGFPI